MRVPGKIKVYEVGPRDGLQNEQKVLAPEVRVAFIKKLAAAGLPTIEVGSFVSPKAVPQMADADEVMDQLQGSDGTEFSVLVPNFEGFEAALAAGVRSVAVLTAASETFCQRNVRASVEETFVRIAEIITRGKEEGVTIRGYLSCAIDCPFEGAVEPEWVASLASRLWKMGCQEVSLADSIGTATPSRVQEMINLVGDSVPRDHLAVHFHDTYGQALANTLAALECGISVVDGAAGGLGGCPIAESAAGNLATEDLVYMLDGMGIETGIDIDRLIEASLYVCQALGREPESCVGRVSSMTGKINVKLNDKKETM